MPICYRTWSEYFKNVSRKDYFKLLENFLDFEYKNHICYPPKELLFNAFELTPLEQVKVVIVGQDPYHEPNQAMGLSFSVNKGIKVPPSLINIYKEIEQEFGCVLDKNNGDLTFLAKQGVLCLNSILSVRQHQPLSHNIKEYQLFLADILKLLNELDQPIVFMLWGGPARRLKQYLNNPSHLILECVHPSPLSANRGGWFGNKHFITANNYLIKNKENPIDWVKQY